MNITSHMPATAFTAIATRHDEEQAAQAAATEQRVATEPAASNEISGGVSGLFHTVATLFQYADALNEINKRCC
jgi:hypothetical protein